jgi:glyoxylate/hydroxypyruvate reductase A
MLGVFYSEAGDFLLWHEHLSGVLPNLQLVPHDQVADSDAVEYAVVWHAPTGFYTRFPNLRAVFSMAAGVDHILNDPTLPASVHVCRLEDAGMADQIAEYVSFGALLHIRRALDYAEQQRRREWKQRESRLARDTTVGILGLGTLGQRAAERLGGLGFHVIGWARRPKPVAFDLHTGPGGFERVVEQSNVLVCLLPLTDETRGLIDASVLNRMPPGGFIVNCARGGHLVLEDLRVALNGGQLTGALLDVFPEEPLPETHWLWSHPRVVVTPHIAARTLIGHSCAQIGDNLSRLGSGQQPTGLVDRSAGY